MNRNRLMLGDAATDFTDQSATIGPLPVVSVDSNLIVIGGVALGFFLLLRNASRNVSQGISRYASHRRSRSRRIKALKAELSSL